MAEVLQVVFDTNVLVAALRSRNGASFELLSRLGTGAYELNVSVPLVLEYEDVLNRPDMVPSLSSGDIGNVIDFVCSVANRCRIHFLWRPFLTDPKDDMVLELAVAAECSRIVTFNGRDFAGVQDAFGIRVISPGRFLEEIGGVLP